MKSQYVNNKLKFDKHSLVELNDYNINNIEGGSSPTITVPIISFSIIYSIIKTVG